MHLIDCHILMNASRERFHTDCFASLENEPVNLYTIPAISGHTGRARMAGFSIGSAPYVTFVDDDDKVIPGSFQSCIDALQNNPDAIGAFPDEILIDADGNAIGPGRSTGFDWTIARQITLLPFVHHGVVMRRDAVIPLLSELDAWRRFPEQALFGLLALSGNWIHVPIPGYKWRIHGNQVISERSAEAAEVIKFLTRKLVAKR